MTDWVTLAFTTLGAGAVGSIITAYAPQVRERRRARAHAREAIRKADYLAANPPRTPQNEFIAALDNLETAAMLAGLSRTLVELHRDASERYWAASIKHWRLTNPPLSPGVPREEGLGDDYMGIQAHTYRSIVHQASRLLASATWHPIAGAPHRWYQTRRLARAWGVTLRL